MRKIIFDTVSTYSQMATKISVSSFGTSFIYLYLIDNLEPEVNLKLVANPEAWQGLPVILYIAIVIAVLFKIFRVYNLVFEGLGIRLRYDIRYILKPMAESAEIDETDLDQKLKKNRKALMEKCFYKYASTEREKCKIEYHYVIKAMDQLTWFGIVLEMLTLTTIALIVCIFYQSWCLVIIFSSILISLVFLAILIHNLCAKCTEKEVSQIIGDRGFRSQIIQRFNEILN